MDAKNWNAVITSLPDSHLLQTWEWGQTKIQTGWQPLPQVWRDDEGEVVAAALVLQRVVSVGGLLRLRVLYVPKGPLVKDWSDAALRSRILDDLRALAKKQSAIFIKIDPEVRLGMGVPDTAEANDDSTGLAFVDELSAGGWRFSEEQVQYRNTVLVDLTASEEEILGRMKQKTRYNVRLAGRKGVEVRVGTAADLGMLYRMYAETSVRDGFAIREEAYYRTVWETFLEAGMLEPLVAEVEGEAVAALMLFHVGGRAWYLHGMSTAKHRNKMPNYLLQWEAVRRAKALGCMVYDLWGAPDVFDESDSMWGVFRFKRGLGGEVARHVGAWDLPVRPWLFRLYTQVLPRLLNLMRWRGRARTREEIGGS